MDIQQIKNFLILCNTLNFRKAAEQVNIVQPALSRQIQLLENEIGAILFNRSKRTVTLTGAGLFFQKEADRIVQDLNKTITRAAQLHNGEAGEIRGYACKFRDEHGRSFFFSKSKTQMAGTENHCTGNVELSTN
jgi:DNA-binding transcriptional LysR family regulator